MKTFLFLFFTSTLIVAQTTHDLDWSISSGTNLDLTINQGDTVRWNWTDVSIPHTVVSTGGVDSFNSGATQTGNTETFEYTFNIVGATDYICGIHTTTMGGTITVNSTVSIEDFAKIKFDFSPNPVEDVLNINADIYITKIEVYSILGKKIIDTNTNSNKVNLDVSSFKSNVYYVKLFFKNGSTNTFTLLKE